MFFVQSQVMELLPPRAGTPATKKKAAQVCKTEAANGEPPLSDSEFRKAVQELVKSKLEKPKRLGELATRWWNEITYQTLEFARQEREADELRKLSPTDLMSFASTVLQQPSTRRKAIVAAHAAEGPAAEPVGSAKGALAADNQPVQVVECVSEFKRSCDVWPNVGAWTIAQKKLKQGQEPQ